MELRTFLGYVWIFDTMQNNPGVYTIRLVTVHRNEKVGPLKKVHNH